MNLDTDLQSFSIFLDSNCYSNTLCNLDNRVQNSTAELIR